MLLFGLHRFRFSFRRGSRKARLSEQLLCGSDVVAGIRGDQYVKLLPPAKIITRISELMNRYLLQLPVDDAQAGLKAFNSH